LTASSSTSRLGSTTTIAADRTAGSETGLRAAAFTTSVGRASRLTADGDRRPA
jgi:hypothetical protein